MKQSEIIVEYQDHMGSDLDVVNAARASFGKESDWAPEASTFYSPWLKPDDAGLIRYLASGYRTSEWADLLQQVVLCNNADDAASIIQGTRKRATHWAPFAHPKVKLRIKMPIFAARQFAKHQIGGDWSEESRRYVSSEPELWFPEHWHSLPDDVKQGSGAELTGYQAQLANRLSTENAEEAIAIYKNMLRNGVAPEEARLVLPLNTMTTVVWTGSLLFWARVCNLRLDSHAQLAATQEIAQKIQNIVQPLFPVSWKELVG